MSLQKYGQKIYIVVIDKQKVNSRYHREVVLWIHFLKFVFTRHTCVCTTPEK